MLSIDAIEDNVRELIRKNDMTNADFARSLPMNPHALNSILEGISKPSLATLIKIANRYRVTLDWLCSGDEQ